MNPLIKQILQQEGVATIVTSGKEGPHVTATWNSYIEIVSDNRLLIPAGGLSQTEKNLQAENKIIMLIGSKLVQGRKSMGTGLRLTGTSEFVYSGPLYDKIKSRFLWARAVLVFTIEKSEQLH